MNSIRIFVPRRSSRVLAAKLPVVALQSNLTLTRTRFLYARLDLVCPARSCMPGSILVCPCGSIPGRGAIATRLRRRNAIVGHMARWYASIGGLLLRAVLRRGGCCESAARFAGVCWRGFAGVCWRVLYGAIVGVNGRLAIVLLRCVGVGLGAPNSGDRAICWRVLPVAR